MESPEPRRLQNPGGPRATGSFLPLLLSSSSSSSLLSPPVSPHTQSNHGARIRHVPPAPRPPPRHGAPPPRRLLLVRSCLLDPLRRPQRRLPRRLPSCSAPPAAAAAAAATSGSVAPAISLTEKALKHLNRMREEKNEDLCLRIGVKQGGCSGMSYTMEFENRGSANPDDSVIEYNGFTIVCDPKSLLFMFGMELDYSDALIGGGFNFQNPNATKTCGCGKSFATGKETLSTATACNN
ncbi:hypothetical protein ACQ4PT_000117 [Festuca glaucescens]